MRDYVSGQWGFALVWGIEASVCPRAFAIAFPNFVLTYLLATFFATDDYVILKDENSTSNAVKMLSGFTGVMVFVLYFRSNIAYARWWEGGTLLQKTRGEWFNAYSSLMAFTSLDPAMSDRVEEFQHMIARLMSLLFCCALQQVSPSKERPFEVLDLTGIEESALLHLNDATDKVEVILQWIQRATVTHAANGVLPVAPPILSRAFQEVSRGIVNLQNARKIADFPFPFPYAQVSMWMLMLHWSLTPMACVMLFKTHEFSRILAAAIAFTVIFFVWCINFIALSLEAPFGVGENDLPMMEMQRDWNKSLSVLLAKWAHTPPKFQFDQKMHRLLETTMSDGSCKKSSSINPELLFGPPKSPKNRGRSTFVTRSTGSLLLVRDGEGVDPGDESNDEELLSPKVPASPVPSSPPPEGSRAHEPNISTAHPPDREPDVDAGPGASADIQPEAVHGFMPPRTGRLLEPRLYDSSFMAIEPRVSCGDPSGPPLGGDSCFGLQPDPAHGLTSKPDDAVNRFINDSMSFPKVMPLWPGGTGRESGPFNSAFAAGVCGAHCTDGDKGYSPQASIESGPFNSAFEADGGQTEMVASQRWWPASFEADLRHTSRDANGQPDDVHRAHCADGVAGHSPNSSREGGPFSSTFEADSQQDGAFSAHCMNGVAGYSPPSSREKGAFKSTFDADAQAGGVFGAHCVDGVSGYSPHASRLRRASQMWPGSVPAVPAEPVPTTGPARQLFQRPSANAASCSAVAASSSAPAQPQSPDLSRVDILLKPLQS